MTRCDDVAARMGGDGDGAKTLLHSDNADAAIHSKQTATGRRTNAH